MWKWISMLLSMPLRLALAWALAAGLSLSGARAAQPNDRITADQSAKSKFHELNFFARGAGMHLSPGLAQFAEPGGNSLENLFGVDGAVMSNRWGVNWNDEQLRPEGFFDISYKNLSVGVLGCVACHSGRVAGQYVIGMGNKNIDVQQIGADAAFIEKVWRHLTPDSDKTDDYRDVENSAIAFAETLSNPDITNLTQGLVPTAVIRQWFYRQAGVALPADFPRGAVKVPALWGYGEKRKIGQFCDGLGNGNLPGWGIAVELVAGQKPEVVHGYVPKIQHAEDMLGDFLPPKYPFPIDATRARRGQALFERTCAECHGTYRVDPEGLPVYEAPRFIDWAVVRTDRDRLDGTTPEFLDLVRQNPLNDIIQVTDNTASGRSGYFAPRLVGIWARFPYLHNASVPSILALLSPPDRRPTVFSLRDAGERERFDPSTLGLTVPDPGSFEERVLYWDAKLGARDVYTTTRIGQSNEGHDFYTDLADEQKQDLIEYLKTL